MGEMLENAIAIGTQVSGEDGSSPGTVHQKQVKPIEIRFQNKLRSVAFFVNGKDIVSGGDDGTMRRWRVEDGTEVGDPRYTWGTIRCIAVSRDGKWVVSGTDNGLVGVWNAENLTLVSGFKRHDSLVRAVDVSLDGSRIATGSSDETTCVWSLSTPERLLGPLKHDGAVLAVKFSPDGHFVATIAWGCDSVRIYDSQGYLSADISVKLPSSRTQILAWTNDSTQLFVLSRDGNINCLNVLTGTTSSCWSIHSSDTPACIALASNGTLLAASANSSVSFWDTTTQKQIGTIFRHPEYIETLAISANQDLAMGGEKAITLCSLRDISSSLLPCSDGVRQCMDAEKSDLEEKIESPHAQEENQKRKIACLENTVQHLSNKLSDSQHRVDSLNETVESLYSRVTCLEQQFRIYEQRHQCEALCSEGRILDAAVSLLEIINFTSEEVGASRFITDWIASFRARCLGALEQHGDAAMDSGSYRDAIDHYTTALNLNPSSTDLLIKRSKARAGALLWTDSLEDADAAIQLDPTSPRGYERRHAALLGACRYNEAIKAYEDMLLKLEQSPDPATRELRNSYVSPLQTTAAIRKYVKQIQQGTPLVLINTGTGRLCDQQECISEFKSDPKFSKLVASMTTEPDDSLITQTVRQYFRYATFSHTWEGAEPLFHEVLQDSVHKLAESSSALKLVMFCRTAQEAGLHWAWSDTCCINKRDSSVLQESLTSMFQWYHKSTLTIVHLKGVRSDSELRALIESFWNTRAWTLQEFVASRVIRFYTEDWVPYLPHESAHNHKESSAIMDEMAIANGVDAHVLRSLRPGSESVRQKLCLAAMRTARRQEDIAYSLFGIFEVSIQVTYGEGQQCALGRLLQEVLTRSGDVTILAWTGRASEYNSCLPAEISVYREPVSLYIPLPIEDGEMAALVAELPTSMGYLDSAMMLYDELNDLPSPRVVSRRLSLSCITFPVKCLLTSSGDSQHVYHLKSTVLGNVEIKTTEYLSCLKNLMLVHPWFRCLSSEDVFADNDSAHSLTTDSSSLAHLPPHTLSPLPNKLTRALRLFVRLRQQFGALFLAPLSRWEYKRVASDCPIVVQLLKDVSPRDLAQKNRIRTLDIL